MTRRQRLRNAGQLCLHCLRNLAYFRASQESGMWRGPVQFWVTVNNNFLDIAVLEWCTLFVDRNAMHYWKKVVRDQSTFHDRLLVRLRLSEDFFDCFTVNRYV
jgi:hypothetical protein